MIRINRELLQYITELQDSGITCETYGPGEEIIGQKKRVLSVRIVKSGIVKCYLTEDNGNDFIQEFFGEGEIFGEIEVLNGNPSFCALETITDTEVCKIPGDRFGELLQTDKKFNELILKALASKVHYTAIRHSYHQSHAIEDNLLRLKKQFPRLIDVIAKRDIANYLGVTLRSLNRTINGMRNKGI
ncbi:Crp/Fnr family transcriptional regulator [Sinomicrobium weinanense]|uniref:Crp/Fnr family transcriptional regulator n=1 Tax=Sinomicrobium weinanense TaxID=2842200 RepID=A0A926Q5T8_9FLAO|nr:Crp/Fnr family transcriptional regulator [Sinomicrobium weinanense]MBC9798506.1 Crp/Fnr family transcriptional regulator [Sinomicrobium weinanense]MBU3122489.1 Crp/Fnr family transcriptional regulator [Sinomicrobium weinanense]